MKSKKTVLVTGATGFIGQQVIHDIRGTNHIQVRLAIRASSVAKVDSNEETIVIPDINGTTNWTDALKNCDVIIHTAARVHVIREYAANPLEQFREVNVEGTINLARQAAQHGVKRFIFVSSIKVNGEETGVNHPFCAEDKPAPEDPYGISKYEAEQGLLELSKKTPMEIVIIRPTMVYGSGVKGNFPRMMNCLNWGLPLPLKSIQNKRSFVSVYNLSSLIIKCIDHPNAANQIFLVSDNEDLSTAELLRKTANAMNKPVHLIPLPYWILNIVATLLGQQTTIRRLCHSLQVDIRKTMALLDWKPEMTVDEGLYKTIHS